MKINEKELMQRAIDERKNSYSPYSKFAVGAALLMNDGTYIVGANIENASYGLCMCAERNTIFQSYNRGYRKEDILAMAVVADTKSPVSPCGACRQVMAEMLDVNTPIYLGNLKGEIICKSIEELLPYTFSEIEHENESK